MVLSKCIRFLSLYIYTKQKRKTINQKSRKQIKRKKLFSDFFRLNVHIIQTTVAQVLNSKRYTLAKFLKLKLNKIFVVIYSQFNYTCTKLRLLCTHGKHILHSEKREILFIFSKLFFFSCILYGFTVHVYNAIQT